MARMVTVECSSGDTLLRSSAFELLDGRLPVDGAGASSLPRHSAQSTLCAAAQDPRGGGDAQSALPAETAVMAAAAAGTPGAGALPPTVRPALRFAQ